MAALHDSIIASSAKSALEPLGFRRKGRSRLWFADHGWWAIVVEFQPSSWSKGSYLNVAAHWLWSPDDYLSFDYGGRVANFVEYVSDDQFSEAATRLAALAASAAGELKRVFVSLPAAAAVLLEEVHANDGGGWQAYHAAIAAGLIGRHAEAKAMFARAHEAALASNPAKTLMIRQLVQVVDDQDGFEKLVRSLIEKHRAALKWSPISGSPIASSP